MICHHYKCIFIHIPKTAGQSVEHVFLDLLGLTWETRAPLLLRFNDQPELGPPRLAHLRADEYVSRKYLTQEMFNEYFKFAFVRNPWSRTVSLYKYLGFSKKIDFNSFLVNELEGRLFEQKRWFVGPQSEFVCGEEGSLLVDYLGRFEDLQSDCDNAFQRIGIEQQQLPHVNESKKRNPDQGSKLKQVAKSMLGRGKKVDIPQFNDWREYYDQDSIDRVARLYQRDVELFNYSFE